MVNKISFKMDLKRLSIILTSLFLIIFTLVLLFFKSQFDSNIYAYFLDNLKENIFEANYNLTSSIYTNNSSNFLTYADRKILTSKYIKEFTLLDEDKIILTTNRDLKIKKFDYKFLDEIELENLKDDFYVATNIKYVENNILKKNLLLIKLNKSYIENIFLKNLKKPLILTAFLSLVGALILFFMLKKFIIRPIRSIIGQIVLSRFTNQEFFLSEFNILQSTLLKHIEYERVVKDKIKFNQEYLRTLLDLQKDIIMVIDNRGKLIDVNNSFFEFFDDIKSIDEFNSSDFHLCDFFNKVDQKGYLNLDELLKENCNSCILNKSDYKITIRDKIFLVYTKSVIFKDENRLIIFFKDITELEHQNIILENRVKEELNNRMIAEKFYENIINSIFDGIIVFDSKLKAIIYNEASKNIFGYKADEIDSTKPFIKELLPKNLLNELQKSQEKGAILELNAVKQGGGDIAIEISVVSKIIDKQRYIIAVIRDLSDKKRQERMLIQQSKMAQMGEMIGSIAHQWKQPLNAIGLYVQEFDSEIDFNPSIDEKLKDRVATLSDCVMRELEFMSETIDDFKNFFKPIKNKEEFSIKRAIDDILNILNPQLRNHSIDVNITNSTTYQDRIVGYKNEFKQVILNLLNNSKDAIDLQKSTIKDSNYKGVIDIFLDFLDGYVFVKVEDNGGGVKESFLTHLFEPYKTTKETGTGIGLYMSKNIIDNMGGELSAKNTNNGASFTIKLPTNRINIDETN